MKHSPLSKRVGWRDLYIAALFENDRSKMAQKIADAQVAIGARRQKIFMSEDDPEERKVLDNALFSLQALANCLSPSSGFGSGPRAA